MKNTITIFLALLAFSCKSHTVSLEQAAQCRDNPNCPVNFNYVKDINNTLNKYIGTWKGIYDGKIYEVRLLKKENVDVDGIVKDDRLIGRLKISDQNGFVLYNTFGEQDDMKTHLNGLNLASNLQHYMMYFSDDSPKGCINYGTIYLTIKPATPDLLNIYFTGEYDIVQGECSSTFKTTIPEKQNIYLTKQ